MCFCIFYPYFSHNALNRLILLIPVSIRLPEWMVKVMDQLVSMELFPNRSELIREAIRALLKKYLAQLQTTSRYEKAWIHELDEE